jgi:hypothetical protein
VVNRVISAAFVSRKKKDGVKKLAAVEQKMTS